MENAIAVANYFVRKSLDTGIALTPMKVVKLVYIAHGWYLGLTNEPLIAEGVQAWKYGPVVPSVYSNFRHYAGSAITQPAHTGIINGKTIYYTLTDKTVEAFLDKIWEVYKNFDGIQLSAMTHQAGTPWYKSWNDLGGKDNMQVVIPNDLIKSHYKQLATANVARSATATNA